MVNRTVSVNPTEWFKGNTEGTRTGDSVETTRAATPIDLTSRYCRSWAGFEDIVRSASMEKMQSRAEMTRPTPILIGVSNNSHR